MSQAESARLLASLDHHRSCLSQPGPVGREYSPDGAECRIVLTRVTPTATVIADEKAAADRHGYRLEWKVYGHDRGNARLVEDLLTAGFVAEDEEQVLVIELTGAPSAPPSAAEIVCVSDARGLADVAAIGRDIGRADADAETARLAAILRHTPGAMTIHVLRADGEPVACGRTHYAEGTPFAELAGGRTARAHRRRGHFSALVRHRLAEAGTRGCTHALVDARTTSESILRGLGFTPLTTTRPLVYEPRGAANGA